MRRTKLVSRSVGGLGGSGGEKVFFDDGQVRVTESLVTIGVPWNKAFAVREITSVTYGKNHSTDLGLSILRSVGKLALLLGLLLGLAGVWSGLIFGIFMGVSLLIGSRTKDDLYCVSLCSGGFWETEHLSSKSLQWCEAVALAVHEAIAYKPEPPSNDGGQFIPTPQSRLRN